ncbi:hypothetical protein LCGC14_3032180, partial [marine sediment metagenome]
NTPAAIDDVPLTSQSVPLSKFSTI